MGWFGPGCVRLVEGEGLVDALSEVPWGLGDDDEDNLVHRDGSTEADRSHSTCTLKPRGGLKFAQRGGKVLYQ